MGNYQPASGGALPSDPTFNTVTAGAITSTTTVTAGGAGRIDGTLDHNGSQVGFYGTTPATRPNIAPAATDLATVITLANSIRDGLRNAANGVGLMG